MSEDRDQRCATCRWWAPNQGRRAANPVQKNVGACRCPKLHTPAHDIAFDVPDGAVAEEGTLLTGPGFGCLHHEPKADTPAIIEGNP